jgi:D-arabinose 1-dehydrogenase-like Zn-dependent alcohol dehydrogenase
VIEAASSSAVKAFVLKEVGATPVLDRFGSPQASDGTVEITLSVAGLNPFDVAFSKGGHPAGVPPVPSVVGREGVGTAADGRRLLLRRSSLALRIHCGEGPRLGGEPV